MKSALLMSRPLANSAATFTLALRPNTMPLGLIRNTWPLAVRVPKIWLGFWSKMRLRAAEDCDGCRNCTVWLAPMLKLDQLMISWFDCWLICVLFAFGAVMVPRPPTTCPPWGLASTLEVARLRTSEIAAGKTHRRRQLLISETANILASTWTKGLVFM